MSISPLLLYKMAPKSRQRVFRWNVFTEIVHANYFLQFTKIQIYYPDRYGCKLQHNFFTDAFNREMLNSRCKWQLPVVIPQSVHEDSILKVLLHSFPVHYVQLDASSNLRRVFVLSSVWRGCRWRMSKTPSKGSCPRNRWSFSPVKSQRRDMLAGLRSYFVLMSVFRVFEWSARQAWV